MKRSQVDRSVLARRAGATGSTGSVRYAAKRSGVSRNLAARVDSAEPYGFTGTRRHGNKRTVKGGSGADGARGMWGTVSQYTKDGITVDQRWQQTVGNQNSPADLPARDAQSRSHKPRWK